MSILRVIKIGTSILRGSHERTTASIINSYSRSLSRSINKGDRIVLVSSGAVGLGCNHLGIKNRPTDIVSLQAIAAIGQGYLMSLYEQSMNKHGHKVAQVLLTRYDLESRKSYQNASNTLLKLLDWGVLPVVNENDTLSSDELKYGDNDTLSALVATALNADQLILLTDVDRLYSSDPRTDNKAKPITDVHHLDIVTNLDANSKKSGDWGTGGMNTKLSAAKVATSSGITVHMADGRNPTVLDELLNGSRGGTVFHPHPQPMRNRKSWLAHALKPVGRITIDQGACKALLHKGASLLLVGIIDIEGNFDGNQPVTINDENGNEIARGISSLGSYVLRMSLKRPKPLGQSPIAVHRDVLVLREEYLL